MASANESVEREDQKVPDGDEEERDVRGVQSHYLRCPSPSFSMTSESRFSMISGSDAASIFMEPIHLSSAIAAKKIINEELPPRGVRTESIPESMMETAEQLMVEDLYNRVRDMIDDRSPYNTPCVLDIQRAMVQDRLEAPVNPVDEVWPNIFIAEKSVAVNKARLKRMGITHILNTAHGTGVYTNQSFYNGIQYKGIEVDDFPDADISPHFRPTAEFLDEALLTHKGKVLVVSMMGISRSAVLVAAYLMIFQNMTIMEALTSIRKKRAINPNEGFLKQLRELNETLLEERDDDDETLSQCSVIDARSRARIFGEGGDEDDDDEDTDKEEEQSMMEVKAHSIMMEEEEDGESVMSSVASSAAAAALKSGLKGAQNGMDSQALTGGEEQLVPPEHNGGEDREDDDGLDSMIREWQRRNEIYQSDDWWEAQLNSEEEDGESLAGGRPKKTKEITDADVESVTSEDVRAVKERLKRRIRRPPSDAMSTSSCSSYSDLWKQRLKEIEEQAAARYRKKEDDEGSESTATEGEGGKQKIDDEVQSILSDTTSMYNFCQKNKDKMTPLERWRIKRIQFGWNKKDREDGEKSSVGDGEKGDGEGEAKTPSFQDVNLTAYQSWKLRQQKRLGEDNTDEILELSRGEDSATVKRRQRREEILERSKKTLEESQSMCGWETESCVSGGTIPLSAFWAGAGVAGPPSVANDDNMSMLSGRSSVISSVSKARSTRSVQSAVPPNPMMPVPPILPVPAVQGPGGEPMVNLASIQNWIANVVSETIKQKQSEMSLPPPSRAGSELSFGGASSVLAGRGVDDDKASLLSGASYSSALSKGRGGAASALSGSSSISGLSGRGSALGSDLGSTLGSKKNKITTTSVPLFSLFQDQVNLGKLDAMDKEIKTEMREKMATYEKKKILEDNKRSTLYKKKKPKEDEDEEEERKKREEEFLEGTKKKEKPKRSYGLSGCLNLNPALEKNKNTSIDDWLESVRPPPRKSSSGPEADPSEDPYDDLDASASEFDFSSRRASYTAEEDDEETYGVTSRHQSRLHEDLSREDTEYSYNGFSQSRGYSRAGRSSATYEESDEGTESYGDFTQRKFPHRSRHENSETEGRRSRREDTNEEEGDDIATFIAQTRQRVRARAAAETLDDEVLTAWRAQQEAKAQSRSES
ncbi:serine/threonine/tyrosine-interacting-like protein 2 [Leuresthes tenuis]|uniref:serine/threonine/tyrosine-interacting-like protein 2 n=1 Tax=Leuresthes tenuis TaxID=355514 RepID=UPI003B5125F8